MWVLSIEARSRLYFSSMTNAETCLTAEARLRSPAEAIAENSYFSKCGAIHLCGVSGDIFKSNSMTNLSRTEYVCGIVLALTKIS